MESIRIISAPSQEKQYAVIYKPRGLPTAPLSLDDKENAFFQASEFFPELLSVNGRKEVEHGLIHRLDTVTDGLVVIASTQESFDELLKLQESGKIRKYYHAVCNKNKKNAEQLEGFPEFDYVDNLTEVGKRVIVESYFRGFGPGNKMVRPVTEKSGKAALNKVGKLKKYTTEVELKSIIDDKIEVECSILNGYRHQVRCHLAWIGFPIQGDSLYNAKDKNNFENNIKFTASKIDINGKMWYI